MIIFLTFIGKNSSRVLLIGLFIALVLSSFSSVFRPILPYLIMILLGVAIARLNIAEVLGEITKPIKLLKIIALILVFMPVSCFLLVSLWRLFGLNPQSELLLIVFAAAPPLSSAASLCLLLGYNARITVQVTLLAQLIAPILGPLCFAIIEVPIDIEISEMMLGIAQMVIGGIVIGFALQFLIGKEAISRNPQAFNGVAVLIMCLFLLTIFEGVTQYVLENPILSTLVFILAILLNIGGNVLVRILSQRFTDKNTAYALGLMFGNRNLAFYYVILPFNPLLSIFIATSQFPMYSTPALFSYIDKRITNHH